MELEGIVPIDDPVWALEDEDVLLTSGTLETLAVDKPSPCSAMPTGTCGGISDIKWNLCFCSGTSQKFVQVATLKVDEESKIADSYKWK